MSVDRLQRLDSLLRRVIAESMFQVLQGDSVAPGTVTVTKVSCGKDLRDATVYVSVFGDDAFKHRAIRHLQSRARRFQQAINAQVRMKFTPRLLFKLDLSIEKGDAVLALIDSLNIPADDNGQSVPTENP